MKVKICGLTREDDAALAVELGADLVGINFWPRSPRGVDIARGAAVAQAARAAAARAGTSPVVVGIFVDQEPAFVAEAIAAAGLDLVQLHGDEDPAARDGARVLKAFRVGEGFDAATAAADWPAAWGFLFDASRPGEYGGTGASWPWHRVASAAADRPVLVAGGIAPGRVRALLAEARGWRPWGIDVCSGVERSPGVKDATKLRALLEEVRDAEVSEVA